MEINNDKSKRWPIPFTLRTALNGFYEELLNGYVKILSREIENPVIFVTLKENSDEKLFKDCSCDELYIINNLWEEEDKGADFCRWLRQQCKNAKEDICDKSDFSAASKLAKMLPNKLPDGWKICKEYQENDHRGIKTTIYSYECDLGFCEWITPVYVEDNFQGAFITGQYAPEHRDEGFKEKIKLAIKSKCKEISKDDIQKKLNDEETKWKTIPDSKIDNFIKKLYDVQRQINELHEQRKDHVLTVIQKEILDVAWGIKPHYNSSCKQKSKNESDLQNFEDRLVSIRTYTYDAIIRMCDMFELQEFIMYEPSSNINGKEYKAGEINGAADLLKECKEGRIKEDDDELTINRKFFQSEHNLCIKEFNKRKKGEPTSSGELKYWRFDGEDIRGLLSPNSGVSEDVGEPNYLNGSSLIVCHMEKLSSQFVAYYFKVKNESDSKIIENILQTISTVFLAQWNGVFSEYHLTFYENSNQYIAHELGQVFSGFQFCLDRIKEPLASVLSAAKEEMLKSYPEIPEKLKNLFRFSDVCISNLQNSLCLGLTIVNCPFIKGREIKPLYFSPYGMFIHRLKNIYERDCEIEHKQLVLPDDVNYHNSKYPDILADPMMIEQSINNLLKNSIKYSHYFTNIYLTAQKTIINGKAVYEFVITNYGAPIGNDDKDAIFELGYRGDNGKLYDGSGLGFGLYIAKYYAQMHGGDVELLNHNIICKYNIPLLNIYSKSTYKNVDKDIQEECKKLISELSKISGDEKESLYADVVFEDPDKFKDNPFKPLYYVRRIFVPTARMRFRLWIPIKTNEKNKEEVI